MTSNRTNFLAQKAMRKKGDTKDRAEQLLTVEILQYHAPRIIDIKTEVKVTYDREDETTRDAYPDIVFLTKEPLTNNIIRIMGQYHDTKTQTRKDEIQKEYLLQRFDTVTDVWYWEAQHTFKRNKRPLSKEELIKSHKEIKKILHGVVDLLEPSIDWLKHSQHLK